MPEVLPKNAFPGPPQQYGKAHWVRRECCWCMFSSVEILRGKLIRNMLIVLFNSKPNLILCNAVQYSKVSNMRTSTTNYP